MKYKSINDEIRYYPTLGVLIEPNAVVEIAEPVEAHGLIPSNETKKEKIVADVSAEGVSE